MVTQVDVYLTMAKTSYLIKEILIKAAIKEEMAKVDV